MEEKKNSNKIVLIIILAVIFLPIILIVLLIGAGIFMALLFGDNGVLNRHSDKNMEFVTGKYVNTRTYESLKIL